VQFLLAFLKLTVPAGEIEVFLHDVEVLIELNPFQVQHQADLAACFQAFLHFVDELLVFLAGNLPGHVSYQGLVGGLFQNLKHGILFFFSDRLNFDCAG
jgi:hypothetical protein